MVVVLLAIGCATGFVARFVAGGTVEPINQLVDVVHALNKLDFSQQVCIDRSLFEKFTNVKQSQKGYSEVESGAIRDRTVLHLD